MKSFTLTVILFALLLISNYIIAQPPTISLSPVISTGLSSPVQFVNAGDGSGRSFIVQQGGTIRVYDKAFNFLGTFLTAPGVNSGGERGLLSMAFHPGYASNGFFYVYYTNTNGDLELSRFKVSSDPNIADAASKKILITIPHPTNNNHNGGELHFGNDGFLYLSTGDGGGGGDVPNNSQTTTVLLGKILRFAVNTSDVLPYYTIPADNPFGNEVFAYGLRNPFRWSFDRLTNDMWIGDVGQDAFEEINFRPADSTNGVNYGWRCYEGPNTFNNSVGCTGPITKYTFPIYTFPTEAAQNISITGGTVYRGSTFIDLQGYYLAAEFYTGALFKIKRNTPGNTLDTSTQVLTFNGITDFGENEDGELYITSLIRNSVQRVLASGAVRYSFTGNGNWNDAANWSNNTIPPASLPSGSEILIDPAVNGECVLDIAQTISPGARLIVKDDKQFRVLGNLTIQ